jgi:hypothetical protein
VSAAEPDECQYCGAPAGACQCQQKRAEEAQVAEDDFKEEFEDEYSNS